MAHVPTLGRLWLADAHADSLMWNRDLRDASLGGDVDFPRLREAGVGLQCFTLVTHGYPFLGGFPLFARYRRWPAAARADAWSRANFQIDQLERYCAGSGGSARVVTTAGELAACRREGTLAAVLGVEGAHALGGEAARVQVLHARGVRFMGLTHLGNNELGGSSFPLMGNRGLSALGRDVLGEMGACGMSVDVAHASKRTLQEILDRPDIRPFCSHTGAAALASPWRNLDDASLRRIADRGGVVGIILAPVYLGGSSLSDVSRHVEHAVNLMGEDAVCMGSDFDGMVPLPKGIRDVRDVPRVLETLRARGMGEACVEKVAGANLARFFAETLGSRPVAAGPSSSVG